MRKKITILSYEMHFQHTHHHFSIPYNLLDHSHIQHHQHCHPDVVVCLRTVSFLYDVVDSKAVALDVRIVEQMRGYQNEVVVLVVVES